ITWTRKSHFSSGNSSSGETCCRPALLTSTSTGQEIEVSAWAMLVSEVTSKATASAEPPAARIPSATVPAPSADRSLTTRWWPAAAGSRAMPAPMPLAAPVMRMLRMVRLRWLAPTLASARVGGSRACAPGVHLAGAYPVRHPTQVLRMSRHFSMLREFQLADWFTLANAFCGTGAVFAAMRFLQDGRVADLMAGMALIPLAFIFDALDGRVARWRKSSSTLGRELDSLADVISFGLAPAALAYACGMQGGWDW